MTEVIGVIDSNLNASREWWFISLVQIIVVQFESGVERALRLKTEKYA